MTSFWNLLTAICHVQSQNVSESCWRKRASFNVTRSLCSGDCDVDKPFSQEKSARDDAFFFCMQSAATALQSYRWGNFGFSIRSLEKNKKVSWLTYKFGTTHFMHEMYETTVPMLIYKHQLKYVAPCFSLLFALAISFVYFVCVIHFGFLGSNFTGDLPFIYFGNNNHCPYRKRQISHSFFVFQQCQLYLGEHVSYELSSTRLIPMSYRGYLPFRLMFLRCSLNHELLPAINADTESSPIRMFSFWLQV